MEELQAFIGMNIVMGMLQLPQVRDYCYRHEHCDGHAAIAASKRLLGYKWDS